MLADTFDIVELTQIWHEYRILILGGLLNGMSLAWIMLVWLPRWWRRRERLSSSPNAGSPSLAPAAIERNPVLNDKGASIAAEDKQHETRTQTTTESVAKDVEKTASRPRLGPKRVTRTIPRKPTRTTGGQSEDERITQQTKVQPLVFFSSLTGSTERYATEFANSFRLQSDAVSDTTVLDPQLHDLSYIDYDEFFITPPRSNGPTDRIQYFYLLLVPTYNIDTVLNTFLAHLQETHHDFRIDTGSMSGLLGYSVFGFGDKEGWPTEEEGFCSQAREVDKWMARLTGRKRAFPLGMGDVKSDALARLEEWGSGVKEVLNDLIINGGLGEGVSGSGDAVESDDEDLETAEANALKPGNPMLKKSRLSKSNRTANVDDLEDLGDKVPSNNSSANDPATSTTPLAIDFTTSSCTSQPPAATQSLKEMVPITSPTYAALTKQGYTIVGSHSGVKICRWTKSALRGRGSCYKFSFYGIKSHLCMETTPSLSCSNKCVFCWRHGTNPVGTTWRWKVDPPDLIFNGVKEGHYRKIKMLRGVPGVRAERFAEAMRIRHCALSLVGEPIFYPHINDFTALLHRERISSFVVCNAQHPAQLAALRPVTQLYVSIDASNRESLRRIDRPLHRDFWERFQACLDVLREKRGVQRTVFRLTLVKGFNVDEEVEGYAGLVERGLPCFVEVKGVTYCGTSDSKGAGLTMQNVPFWEEVEAFVVALSAALARRGLDYGLAAEHRHSCCVLIASKRFLIQGKWHTTIGYDKFFECLESGREFGPEDYVGDPTPEWALWGKGGFDPADERVYRKGKNRQGGGGSGEGRVLEL